MFASLRLSVLVCFFSLCFLLGARDVVRAGGLGGHPGSRSLGLSSPGPDGCCDCSGVAAQGSQTNCGWGANSDGGVAHAGGGAAGHRGRRKSGCRLCGGSRWNDGTHCGLPAPKYPVPFATPRPTTPTYHLYPPMMPHHSLPHYRSTYAFRHGPGLSQTQVHWRAPKLLNLADYVHHIFEIPR